MGRGLLLLLPLHRWRTRTWEPSAPRITEPVSGTWEIPSQACVSRGCLLAHHAFLPVWIWCTKGAYQEVILFVLPHSVGGPRKAHGSQATGPLPMLRSAHWTASSPACLQTSPHPPSPQPPAPSGAVSSALSSLPCLLWAPGTFYGDPLHRAPPHPSAPLPSLHCDGVSCACQFPAGAQHSVSTLLTRS